MTRPAALDMKSRKIVGSDLVFPSDLGAHGLLMAFREYDYAAIRGTGSSVRPPLVQQRLDSTIMLPLPQNLQDSVSVRIQRFEQEFVGELVSLGVNQLAATAKSDGINPVKIANAISDLTKQVIPAADLAKTVAAMLTGRSVSSDSASALSFLGRRVLGDSRMGNNVDIGLGSMVNPKAALSFEGVDMKSHNFNWTLAPRNIKESENLKNIITMLKRKSLPTYINITGGQDKLRAMFRYPSMVDIYLLGVDDRYYYSFKTSMIMSVRVSYTPQGLSVLKGGKPAAVELEVSLMETDVWTAADLGAKDENVPEEIAKGGTSVTDTSVIPRSMGDITSRDLQ